MSSWFSTWRAGFSLKKTLKKRRFILLSFFIPFFILLLAYASRGIFPFGNRNLLTIDLFHQYAPFIAELKEKLAGAESIFYSWSGGLGTNFYALFAYYLASPLNFLTILFPASGLTESILFLTLVKVGLSGACFYLFLRGTYGREGHYAVAFASMYALSAYVLSYSWNIMWLDGIYLLPLIMLGLVQLLRDDRYMLYTISLALMIASNYYIAFFVCLFTVLYFPVLLLRYQSVRRFPAMIMKIVQFGFFSLMGGGLASVMLLPTYMSLKLTSAAGDKFPTSITHYFDLFDYLGQHLMLPAPTIRDGMPNMYAGLLAIILVPLFFLSKRICLREKFGHIILILVMILSFNINVLNFIWHGMHFPNQLPYRNSFVYVFLILAMLYPLTGWIREIKGRAIGAVCLGLMLITLLNQKLNETEPSVQSIYITILFLAIYAAVLTLDRVRRLSRRDMARAVLLLVTAELLVNTLLMVHEIDSNEHYSSREGYASGVQVEAIRDAIDKIEKEENDLFWRMEILQPKTTNDPYLYGFKGLSLFASTAAEQPVKMFQNLGFHSNGINSYKYEGSTLVLDSLLGVRYLVRRGSTVAVDEQMRQLVEQNDQLSVYKNSYALPVGYLGTEALESWKSAPGNPLDAQNRLVEALGGLPEVMMPVDQQQAVHENMTLDLSGTNTYRYTRSDTGQKSTARIQVINPVAQNLYIYLKVTANHPQEGYVLIDGERISFNARRSTMVDLGYVQADANIEFNLIFDTSAPKDSQFEFYSYALDVQAFEQSMELISRQGLTVTDISSRKLEGTVTTDRDGVFLMTIPYDTGWQVRVDGKKTESYAIDDGFLAFRLDAGNHEITLKYTPPWFTVSLLISLGSVILLLIIYRLPGGPGSKRRFGLPVIFREWQIVETKDEEIDNI
ncbi:MAG: YfhO family protein [Eubacteriales bacterium]|nr:YfhO family protein [Eubacteriales bacterium]